jgi:hypothetical protein
MKKLVLIIACLAMVTACATPMLPKDATIQQYTEAVCSDLTATILATQISLALAQKMYWDKDFSPSQKLLLQADALLKGSCSTIKSEMDLIQLRNAVLAYMADAARQQVNPQPWK